MIYFEGSFNNTQATTQDVERFYNFSKIYTQAKKSTSCRYTDEKNGHNLFIGRYFHQDINKQEFVVQA